MGTPTSVYPPDEQRERWEQRADELDMSVASFVAAMTEAGMKKFERDIEPDHTRAELKAQRADLLDELNQARERIERLSKTSHTRASGKPSSITSKRIRGRIPPDTVQTPADRRRPPHRQPRFPPTRK